MESIAAIVVVGSANVDTVFTLDRAPGPGETVLAETATEHAGGKGLNQAVAAARAGSHVTFIGALGRDSHGDALERVMVDAGIDGSLVRRADAATGQAFIVVDAQGENSIVVASGANATVDGLTDRDRLAIAAAHVLVLQFELPMPVVAESARVAAATETIVVLNAAPARPLDADLDANILADIDVLVVNEHEAVTLSGAADLDAAIASLADRVDRVIVTLGSRGSVLVERGIEVARVDAHTVTVVDSTGAGDTFCGAFAAALAIGSEFVEAARFATAAAALSVTVAGAVPSIPERAGILEAMS